MIIKRQKYVTSIEKAIKNVPIIILIGARQVGKTTLMKNLEFKGKTLLLNGQDAEVAELFQKLSIIENYLALYLGKKITGCLQIDEFQYIQGISTILKLLSDKYTGLKIICTGSSSLELLQKVEESLAGRVRVIEVFSLSFEEHLKFSSPALYKLYTKYNQDTEDVIVNRSIPVKINEYLIFGGFPRVSLENNEQAKIELLDDIYKTYLLRDVRSYVKNEDFVGFNKMLKLLAAQIGNLVNLNELSRSSGLTHRKCEEYISLLEQMYIIILLEPYQSNKRNAIKKMKKVYFSDLGLRNIIYGSFQSIEMRTDNGALFENFVLLELLRNTGKQTHINFFRTTDGTEIDFILNTLKETIAAEVKFKRLENPVSIKSMDTFFDNDTIGKRYIFNKNFNYTINNKKYIQAYLAGKIQI